MAKIQTIGVGKYIRSHRGTRAKNSRGMNIEVLWIGSNNGNSFTCFPVTDANARPVGVDRSVYFQIPIDTHVEEVSIGPYEPVMLAEDGSIFLDEQGNPITI